MNNKMVNIVGVHQRLESYPNVLFLLDELEQSGSIDYKEYNVPMWSGSLSSKKTIYIKVKNLFKAFYSHLNVLYYIFKTPNLERVYIPYPAIFIASALSFFPKKKKPKYLAIDAFISVYDTAIIDRNLYLQSGLIARFLKKLEKTAFEQANIVITDTYQNSVYYSQLFDLSIKKFKDLPLATDEKNFNITVSSSLNKNTEFNVIFIGTLIPLHGIETILKAAKILVNNNAIQFTVIGDGQMSQLVENAINNGASNIKWVRKWQSSIELANHLSQADIGLGVFGIGEKTQRVCPFKLYIYMACGLPVITGETSWSRKATKEIGYSPLLTVPVGVPEELVSSILECYKSEKLCAELSLNSRRYYDYKLANRIAREQIESIFTY